MDPFSVLGVGSDAPPSELAAAYRRAAKRWHPDRGGGERSEVRMAEINAAYDLVRDGGWRSDYLAAARAAESSPGRSGGSPVTAPHPPGSSPATPRRPRGSWLAASIRRGLGEELVAALKDAEDVVLVAPAATWASPQTILAVTDRRLLWLNDDAISDRVQSVPFSMISEIRMVRRRFRSHVASVQLRTTLGRRLAFAELRPAIAGDIVRRVSASASTGS